MLIRILTAGAFFLTQVAYAERDEALVHNVYLIEAVTNAANSCVKYSLQKLGEALPGYQKLRGNESPERREAWRHITYTRNFEACIAEAASEMAQTSKFDHEKGKDALKRLDPLYSIEEPVGQVDATVISISPGRVRYGTDVMSLGKFLDVVWAKQLKNIAIENVNGSAGTIFCAMNFGYLSGARIHVRNADGSWLKAVFNAGSGEKGTSLSANQCLSGDIVSAE